MRVFWLDDVRKPWIHGYIGADWAKSYEEAIVMLSTIRFDFADLDHDLTERATLGHWDGELTGFEVLQYMRANNIWPPKGVRVHSVNEEGRKRMLPLIEAQYGRNFQDRP